MQGTFDRRTTPPTLRLQGELVIESAMDLKAQLLEALASGEPARLDLLEVTRVDLTGLQLLAASERAAAARGVPWTRMGALPESLLRTAEEAGWERTPFAGDAA